MTTETAQRNEAAVVQALRDVFENGFGGVLSIHWDGVLGMKPMDAAEAIAADFLVQLEHHRAAVLSEPICDAHPEDYCGRCVERIRTAIKGVGGLEYGTADEGTRYLNSDYISRIRVLAILDEVANRP